MYYILIGCRGYCYVYVLLGVCCGLPDGLVSDSVRNSETTDSSTEGREC